MEECSEIQKLASKSLRFGLEDTFRHESGNRIKISEELNNLLGVIELLNENGVNIQISQDAINAKKLKVKKFMQYSKDHSRLEL